MGPQPREHEARSDRREGARRSQRERRAHNGTGASDFRVFLSHDWPGSMAIVKLWCCLQPPTACLVMNYGSFTWHLLQPMFVHPWRPCGAALF